MTETMQVRVGAVEHLGRVLAFDLEPVEGVLPQWQAGAHVDLLLGDGLIRQYSLCGDPANRSCYRLAVLLDEASRGGSRAVHETVRPGALLQIGAPRNLFPLKATDDYSVLIGGGIGVTPLIAMAHELWDRGATFALHYVARDPVFAEVLRNTPFAQNVTVYDRGVAGSVRFDPAPVLRGQDAGGTHVYTCGPIALMDAVAEAAVAAGFEEGRIHREAFSALPIAGGSGFEVVAARCGVRVQVSPEESITAALARAGVKVQVSCEQGICGTCVVDLIEGEADHRDEYLTEDERGEQIALCCSRARSSLLVVDL
ncbi:PDR/VanB family oxidoreductase (plasmid) [Kozakia baliensis]|uniref:PDR/VanB family oxidoreductase n=1 Tax=Kozakia baliensis TaxID=153496 RepID=UPI00345C5F5A